MSERIHDAMKLLVEWRKMKDLCDAKDECENCPYYRNKSCDLVSTDFMLHSVADVFGEYLAEVEAQ